jgi:hypothetical protein
MAGDRNRLPDLVATIFELRHSAMLRATRAGYAAKSVTHAELEEETKNATKRLRISAIRSMAIGNQEVAHE